MSQLKTMLDDMRRGLKMGAASTVSRSGIA
jgi:hypothetical protein